MWHQQYEISIKIQFKVKLKWFIRAKLSGIITSLLCSIIILILIFPVKTGYLSIGLFISIVNNIISLIQNLSWQLPEAADSLAKNKEYLKDLSSLLNLDGNKEYLAKPSSSLFNLETIEFKNVSFKYPGTSNYILNNINFKIVAGKHYAFVGSNGCGKTTITKLLTGLYDNFKGKILINGITLKNYSKNEIKSLFSVVYQDFAKYSISFKDNILVGNINNYDIDNLYDALDLLDLNNLANNLQNDLDSNLGKIHQKGVDLSGGEWQRIAMARSIINNSSIKILDEPTATIDPLEETRLYKKFKEISKGKTSIIVTHRVGSAKIADKIIVLERGQIIQIGTHYDLINKNGKYKDMFEAQSKWYK